jgi:hypothetical protein
MRSDFEDNPVEEFTCTHDARHIRYVREIPLVASDDVIGLRRLCAMQKLGSPRLLAPVQAFCSQSDGGAAAVWMKSCTLMMTTSVTGVRRPTIIPAAGYDKVGLEIVDVDIATPAR